MAEIATKHIIAPYEVIDPSGNKAGVLEGCETCQSDGPCAYLTLYDLWIKERNKVTQLEMDHTQFMKDLARTTDENIAAALELRGELDFLRAAIDRVGEWCRENEPYVATSRLVAAIDPNVLPNGHRIGCSCRYVGTIECR